MRTIHTDEITKCIKEMCMQVNVDLSPDVKDALLAGKGYRYDRCIFTHRTGSSY